MASYSFQSVLVSDMLPGGGLRTLRNGTVTVKSAADDSTITVVTSDANGLINVTTTDVPSIYYVTDNGFVSDYITAASILVSAGAAALNNDAGVASFVNDSGSATRAALNSTYATLADKTALTTGVQNRAIYVGDYGTLGTGDDSTTIEAALADAAGRRLVFPPDATLHTSGNLVTGLDHAVIDGNGCTLSLNATGARIAGVQLAGVVTDVAVKGLRVVGNAVVADAHVGVLIASGATVEDFRVSGCTVENVTLGISVNADGSGSVNGLTYEGNHVRNVVGTTTGNGYGLHVAISGSAPAGVQIIGNTVRSAQRHSIYQAKGRGISIVGNVLRDHRDANKDGQIYPALMLARSADVSIIGNSILNPAGGGMFLGGVSSGDQAENYTVMGNTISGAQDAAVLVYIGQQDPATEGIPTGVVFTGNILKNSTARGCLQVFNGKQLVISRNLFRCTDASAATSALILNAIGVTGNDYMDDITVDGNFFDQANAGTVLVRFSPGHETDTTRYWFRGNRKVGAKLGVMFGLSAATTNPNIDVQDQPRDGLVLSGVTTLASAFGGPTTTTAPAAGGAGALPATPRGYFTANINGADCKVAYY